MHPPLLAFSPRHSCLEHVLIHPPRRAHIDFAGRGRRLDSSPRLSHRAVDLLAPKHNLALQQNGPADQGRHEDLTQRISSSCKGSGVHVVCSMRGMVAPKHHLAIQQNGPAARGRNEDRSQRISSLCKGTGCPHVACSMPGMVAPEHHLQDSPAAWRRRMRKQRIKKKAKMSFIEVENCRIYHNIIINLNP